MAALRPVPRPVIGIVQARMGSTRLPGKVLEPLAGKSMLAHILERMAACPLLDGLVVATTTLPEDDALVEESQRLGYPVYRGSSEDVLDRFYRAAKTFQARTIVRITADDPFKDPGLLTLMLRFWLETYPAWDYLSNTLEPTYPEGLDLEIFTFEALATAWEEAVHPADREHVTPYIWKRPHRFRLFSWKGPVNLAHLRWTVDYPEDLAFARAVYTRLYPHTPLFTMEDILALLEAEPELARLPRRVPRNEGYLRSLGPEEGPHAAGN